MFQTVHSIVIFNGVDFSRLQYVHYVALVGKITINYTYKHI